MKTALKIFLPILLIYGLYRLIMYTTSDLSSELIWVIVSSVPTLIGIGIWRLIVYLSSASTTAPAGATTTTPASSTPKKSWLSGVRGGVIVVSFIATVALLGLLAITGISYGWKLFKTEEQTLTVTNATTTSFEYIEYHSHVFTVEEVNDGILLEDQKFIITDPIGFKQIQTGNSIPVRIPPYPPEGYVTPAGECKVSLVNGTAAIIKLTQVPLTTEQRKSIKKRERK